MDAPAQTLIKARHVIVRGATYELRAMVNQYGAAAISIHDRAGAPVPLLYDGTNPMVGVYHVSLPTRLDMRKMRHSNAVDVMIGIAEDDLTSLL